MAKGTRGTGASKPSSGEDQAARVRDAQPARRRAAAAATHAAANSGAESPPKDMPAAAATVLPEAAKAPAKAARAVLKEARAEAVAPVPEVQVPMPMPATEPAAIPSLAAMQESLGGIVALLMRDSMRLSQDLARLYDPQPLLGLQQRMLQQWLELATEGQRAMLELVFPANASPWSWLSPPPAA